MTSATDPGSSGSGNTPQGGGDGGGGSAGGLLGGAIKEGEGGIKQALAEGKGWSEDDIMAYAKTIGDNHPMFAESLEEMDPAMVEAIQAIKFEGKNFRELAEQSKKHGNDLFGWGKKNPAQYSNCLPSYTEAICYAREIPIWGEDEADTDEDKCLTREAKALLLSQIYANRAMAHLMLKNYRSCKDDCDRAILQVPTNVKAYYRKARACQGLHQHDEAVQAAEAGLKVAAATGGSGSSEEAAVKELRAIRDKSASLLGERAKREQAQEAARRGRVEARRRRLQAAWALIQRRGLRVGEPYYGGDAGGGEARRQVEALPTLDPATGLAVWPLLLLYPQHLVSDFVERADESDMLALTLAAVLPEEDEGPPPPWDARGEYRCSNVEVYFQARATDRVLGSEAAYVAGVERAYALTGVGEDDYEKEGEDGALSREKIEAELARRNVWRDEGEYWVHVHVGCTLAEILAHPDHVIPATIPTLHVYARSSRAHADFLEKHAGRIKTLNPAGWPASSG